MPAEPRFYTVEEVAEELRLAKSTVYRALEEGRMPGYKVLGRWRVDAGRLDTWIESHSVEPRTRKQSSTESLMAEVVEIRSGKRQAS